MTTSAPIKRKYNIPITLPEPEPKRLNPGMPAHPIPLPVTIPVKEPAPAVRQKK